MNDDNKSPNDTTGENHNVTKDNSSLNAQPKKKSGLFGKFGNSNKAKTNHSNNSNLPTNSTRPNHKSSKPKKSLKQLINSLFKTIKKNKLITLAIVVFVAAIVGATIWYINTRPVQRILDTNNQVITEYKNKLPELKKAAGADSSSAAARKNYAVALYVTGNYEAAKNEYEAVVKLDDKDSTTYNNLGNAYRDLGQYDKAKTAYEKSFEMGL